MNRKTKVMHLILTSRGGTEVYNKMLIHNTSAKNEIVYVCPTCFDTSCFDKSITVYNLDVPREITPSEDFKGVLKFRKILKKERPDILYCHSTMAGAIGRIAAIGKKCKVIYNPHGWSFTMTDCSEKKRKMYTCIERFLAILTDRIITISEFEKKVAVDKKICNPEKITVVLNGVDIKDLSEVSTQKSSYGYSQDDFIVGCVARLTEAKDPVLFAKVAGEIAKTNENARFVWVGDGELREEFEASLKENGVFDKTWITGWVSSPKLYSNIFDVSVLFSSWEGFGLAVPETLALGKPVVTTAVGGIAEIIKGFDVGKIVLSRDPKELAEAVLLYKKVDDALKQRCKERAKDFDFEKTTEKTLRIFEEVMK